MFAAVHPMDRARPRVLVWLTACLAAFGLQAQTPRWMRPIAPRTIEPRLLGGAGLDFQAPKPAGGTLDTALSGPGYGAQLDLGASFTVRDRWGLEVMGSRAWQSNVYWVKDTSCWDLAVPNWRSEAKLWKLFPTNLLESGFVKVGVGGGFSWQEAGSKERNEGIFGVRTQFEAMTRTYWCAELGWWHGDVEDKWELVFRYARHLQRSPAYTAEVYAGPDSKRFTATQDHIAFVFRYHLGFPRRPERGTVAPETDLVERNTDTLTTLATRRASVPLVLWDDAEHDGDTISVVLNGRVVLDHHGLSNSRTHVDLWLEPGENTLLVVAHNEGRVPPNTARAYLRTGKGKVHLLVKTTTSRNAAVRVLRVE